MKTVKQLEAETKKATAAATKATQEAEAAEAAADEAELNVQKARTDSELRTKEAADAVATVATAGEKLSYANQTHEESIKVEAVAEAKLGVANKAFKAASAKAKKVTVAKAEEELEMVQRALAEAT